MTIIFKFVEITTRDNVLSARHPAIMIPHLCYTALAATPFCKNVVFIIFIRTPIAQEYTVFALSTGFHNDLGLMVFHTVLYAHEFVLGQCYCLLRKQIDAIHVSRTRLISGWYPHIPPWSGVRLQKRLSRKQQ